MRKSTSVNFDQAVPHTEALCELFQIRWQGLLRDEDGLALGVLRIKAGLRHKDCVVFDALIDASSDILPTGTHGFYLDTYPPRTVHELNV